MGVGETELIIVEPGLQTGVEVATGRVEADFASPEVEATENSFRACVCGGPTRRFNGSFPSQPESLLSSEDSEPESV